MVEREVLVTVRVTGVVQSIQAERGDAVRAGQPLATLDQREFDLDRRAAEEERNLSRSEYERAQELFKLSLASRAELEQKKAKYELARVEFERAQLVIDRSVIRAPFDGVVADRFVRVGQKLLLEENVPLFRITALEPLLARAYLPEAALGRVRAGDAVDVSAVAHAGSVSTGRVSFVSPVIDPASGTVQVLVKVERDRRRLFRPGLAVKLAFRAP